ncbi:hypothetical protein NQ314_017217 [Rhamnusium bicolor]|uniref:non-specific serine/threonine protein kinase n=1 Tax=Rhamnusium bicolor TaxID=1586634 RepID=A0AAV8WUX9_9CUCU|nr:hypothetical protein NQ314_017217 [Rhamnusium bicolor]
MANRKRGTFSLPEELRTSERLSTKKELAQRKSLPLCPPVPNKIRKSILTSSGVYEKPKAVCFNQSVQLSPLYNPSLNTSYLDQVFSKHGLVGEGSFGRVYRVRNHEDNKLYAIKRLKSVISFKDRYAEVRNNEKVGVHTNCVQFFMAWEEGFEVYMMLEFCDMSLADYSVLDNDIHEDLLWNVLYDICKALNFLHKRDLLHLDVKPGNIMMKNGIFKLADFGILVDLKLAPMVCKSTLSDGDSKYLALEVLEGIYQPSCDIFGLGISLLELAADLELPSYDTPRCVPEEDNLEGGSCRDEENANRLSGRKSLFHLLEERDSPEGGKHTMTLSEMNKLFEASFATKSESSFDTDSSMLAVDMSDSNLTGEIFQMDLEIEDKEGNLSGGSVDTMSEEDDIITSTPNLRGKLSRRLPKTKLTFD